MQLLFICLFIVRDFLMFEHRITFKIFDFAAIVDLNQ